MNRLMEFAKYIECNGPQQVLPALLIFQPNVECGPKKTDNSQRLAAILKPLLSWDREGSSCLAGIQEVRNQGEVLQSRLLGDTRVLHL